MSTGSGSYPPLADLPAFECWSLLESAEIARVAWTGPRGVLVVPVNYTISDGALWFRTTPTAEIIRDTSEQWVAVEVDDLDPGTRSGWSVVVRGPIELVDAEDAPDRLAELRVWPPGLRIAYVRVEPGEVTGRRLLPGA
ncbi:MAG TPA: pyridoxamine 5'-phosphate oxidase family protein [Nocardioides sp.]|uniref:pyridoxamine 5'-phosphate oxidase family protein n=1 Tax=Nocardioides sp. TaxID=35761 RepID=UPI002BA40A79|nr:pyridoxamine 5'-phosphate oxidase family protein [Nocardioides sp.]HTW13843.1 pyridoxamine 5'-phosphate oxidase family protein [Nocardioides sp.]